MRAITRFISTACIGLAASPASTVLAQGAYPDKPIRIIAPCTAGGSADFRALVKAQPGRLSYGSCAFDTPFHLAVERYEFYTGSFVVHASYRGSSPAMPDTIGRQLDAVFAPLANIRGE